MQAKLKEIFGKTFYLGKEEVNENLTTDNVESWDSLGHLNLVVSLEKAFGVRFTPEDIEFMYSNFGNVISKLSEKGVVL